MEGYRPSSQRRKDGGGIDVDIDGMYGSERDEDFAAYPKGGRIVDRDLVISGAIMERGQCGRSAGIAEASESRSRRTGQFEVQVGRGCVVVDLEDPRRADG